MAGLFDKKVDMIPAWLKTREYSVPLLFLLIGIMTISSGCQPGRPNGNGETLAPTTYVTSTNLEPDKLASIWLLRRFVQTNAQFVFIAPDSPVTQGIPFDLPEAEYRRYAALSCYESILQKNSVTHPALHRVGELIHDLEINYWGEKKHPQSLPLKRDIEKIIQTHPGDPQKCLPEALALFDNLFSQLSKE